LPACSIASDSRRRARLVPASVPYCGVTICGPKKSKGIPASLFINPDEAA
jgi:hypothetical protein